MSPQRCIKLIKLVLHMVDVMRCDIRCMILYPRSESIWKTFGTLYFCLYHPKLVAV